MVENAFLNVDNYLNFFKEIGDIYEAKENALNTAFAEINSVYGHLLQDEKIKNPNEFLVPEIPKNKKETKEKQESKQGSQKKKCSLNETFASSSCTTRDKTDEDLDPFRRSSRIASKKILPASSSASESKREVTMNISTSFIQSGSQSKRHNDTHTKKKNSGSVIDDSTVMCLAHSTPLVLSPAGNGDDTVFKTPDEKPLVSKNEENPDSVKKRIEEFEKRVAKKFLPSKLPLRTPDKKKKQVQEEINCSDKADICKYRSLRSDKALQEKNTNIDSSQSQDEEIKKPVGLKNNVTSNKIKPAVITGNFKATNQRPNENNEHVNASKLGKKNNGKLAPSQKKYFNQDKKVVKTQKSDDSSNTLQTETATQGMKDIESEIVPKMNHPEPLDTQYEIDHVLENESSEDEEHPKKQIPNWALGEIREYPLNVQAWINKKETVYPWFYNKNIKNPKLEELFSVSIKMRPRTSSAVWNTKTYFK